MDLSCRRSLLEAKGPLKKRSTCPSVIAFVLRTVDTLISVATSYYSSWGKEGINAIQTIYCPKCWSISICLQHQAAVTGFPLTYTWKRLSLRDSLNCANLLHLFHEKEETLTLDQIRRMAEDRTCLRCCSYL